MDPGREAPRAESREVEPAGATGIRTEAGAELVDEMGLIPSFPPLALDPQTGRMIPLSREETEARRDAALRMLKVLDRITDEGDTDENWREVYRKIDAFRPHRPLFRELY